MLKNAQRGNKKGRRDKHACLSSTREARGCSSPSMPGKSETEEWWFDVHPKGMGKRRPCPIDEHFAESSE